MDGVDTKLLQVCDGPGLCQGEELALVLGILTGDGEVAMVHLIDDEVGRRLAHGVTILCPAFGIGLRKVDDGASLAIDAYGLGKDTRALTEAHVEGVELAHEVAFDGGGPLLVGGALHLHGLHGLAVESLLIDTQRDALGIVGCKEGKLGFLRGVADLLERLCCHLVGQQQRQ